MTPLLAQSTPDAHALSSFLEVTFYLIGIVTAAVVLWKQVTGKSEETRISPQPLEVKEHTTFASREELHTAKTELHGRVKREREEIDQAIQRVEELATRRAEKLEEKVDRNTQLTAATQGEVRQINQAVSQLTTSLTTFLQNQVARK